MLSFCRNCGKRGKSFLLAKGAFSESEPEILFILGQPLAQRATIKVPSEKYNTEHKIARQKAQFKNEN